MQGGVSGILVDGPLDLEIREALLLGEPEQLGRQVHDLVVLPHFLECIDDTGQLVEEPAVDLGQRVDLIHRITGTHGLGDDKDTTVSRLAERQVHIRDLELFVPDEAVCALTDHPEALLDGFLEGPADGHDFADALHAGSDFARDAMELAQIPARNLADDVVQGRFEEGGGRLRHGIL